MVIVLQFIGAHPEILFYGELAENTAALGNVADAQACPLVGGKSCDILPVIQDLSGNRLDDSHYCFDQCGFAGAVGTDAGNQLLRLYVDGDAVKDFHHAVGHV